jgi:FdhE protein
MTGDYLETLRERIEQIKKRRPAYGPLLDFYQEIRTKQHEVKTSLRVEPLVLKKEWKDLLEKEGFPLVQKEDWPIDFEASISLFRSLCEVAKASNPKLSEEVKKIEETLESQVWDLKELLRKGLREKKVEKVAARFRLDAKILLFLLRETIRPSVELTVSRIREELPTEKEPKGTCPICGSQPSISLLREETGKRYLYCDECGYSWHVNRVGCPYCHNKDPQTLHYIFGEGEENCRVDLCDQCHSYFKTVDLRKMEVPDPLLEDIATIHLDLLAHQKGYKRPIPNPWTN